jgi:hypothetical protein
VVFKSIPPEYFAVCFKHYFGLALEERDLKLAFDFQEKKFKHLNIDALKLIPIPKL